jgi:hypothetical protein
MREKELRDEEPPDRTATLERFVDRGYQAFGWTSNGINLGRDSRCSSLSSGGNM